MALETMRGIKDMLGEPVKEILTPQDEFDKSAHIRVDQGKNEITFKIQDGPIKEFGKNGCQLDHMIAVSSHMIRVLNNKFPSEYNEKAIEGLESALASLEARRVDRENRGVEGTSNV